MGRRIENTLIIVLIITVIVMSYYTIPLAIVGFAGFMLDLITIVTGKGGGNLTGLGLLVGPRLAFRGFGPIILLLVLLYIRAKRNIKEGIKPLISVRVIQVFSLVSVIAILVFSLFVIIHPYDVRWGQ
jgi:hypothetical protein